MEYEEFLTKLGLDTSVVKKVLDTKLDEKLIKKSYSLIMKHVFVFRLYLAIQAKKLKISTRFLCLCIYLKVAYMQYTLNLFNMSTEEYFLQFRDIKLWLDEYYEQTGEYGIKAFRWISRSLSGKVMRIGRLQFGIHHVHVMPFFKFSIKKRNILSIHIPKDGKLCYDDVIISFKDAIKKFNTTEIYCTSWLLDKNLRKFINQDSNIIKYQNLFDVKFRVRSKQALIRTFGRGVSKYEDFPENTSLQKKLKEYVIGGGKTYIGYGVLRKDFSEIA